MAGVLEKLSLMRAHVFEIADRYGVSDIRVFGSAARNEDTDASDLDLVVKLQKGRTLLDLIAFKQDLEDLLGKRVDVVTDDGLDELIRAEVLDEAVTV